MHGLLIAVASPDVGDRLQGRRASVVVAHGLSCPKACGILVSGPGMEPMFPALAGGFLTMEPLGKSS